MSCIVFFSIMGPTLLCRVSDFILARLNLGFVMWQRLSVTNDSPASVTSKCETFIQSVLKSRTSWSCCTQQDQTSLQKGTVRTNVQLSVIAFQGHVVLHMILSDRVSQLLSLATTLCSQESSSLGLPDFPVDNLIPALHVLVRIQESLSFITQKTPLCWLVCLIQAFSLLSQNSFPMLSSQQLVQRLYPYSSIMGKEGRTAVEGVLSVSLDFIY